MRDKMHGLVPLYSGAGPLPEWHGIKRERKRFKPCGQFYMQNKKPLFQEEVTEEDLKRLEEEKDVQLDAAWIAETEEEPVMGDSVSEILKSSAAYPVLTPEEEMKYAKLSQSENEAERKEGREKLILHNQKLVIRVAGRYRNSSIALEDLIQEGNLGLMRAVSRFDYSRGFKFSTYATWWIRQAIERAIMNQGENIRHPVHIVEKKKQMKRAAAELRQAGQMVTDENLAEKTGIELDRIAELRKVQMKTVSLNTLIENDGDSTELSEFIEDKNAVSPEEYSAQLEMEEAVRKLLSHLTERERNVISMRYGIGNSCPMTLEEVGRVLGVTRERIRQIESKGLQKLRNPKYKTILKDFLS